MCVNSEDVLLASLGFFFSPRNECHFLIHLDCFRKPNAHYRISNINSPRAGAGNRREALNLGTSP